MASRPRRCRSGLVFFANRVLNPALVLIEVCINLYVLVINWSGLRAVWRRVMPIIVGLLPGVALGSYLWPRSIRTGSSSPPTACCFRSSCFRQPACAAPSAPSGWWAFRSVPGWAFSTR